jgi:6-phosphogluconolactonase
MSPEGEPRILVVPDADAAAEAAAAHLATRLRTAVEAGGRADWATTGGSAAPGIYRRLDAPPLRDDLPWSDIHMWWGDDRFVRRTEPQSNVLAADHELLRDGATMPESNVHPIPVDAALDARRDAAWAAEAYEAELREAELPERDGWPVFDLILIGIGPDGHLLSVFPGSHALDEQRAWVCAIPAPSHVEPHVERVTLTPHVLDAAADVLVVAHGASKADILGRVFGSPRNPRELPAQLARRPGATWIVDEAAAAHLPAELRQP